MTWTILQERAALLEAEHLAWHNAGDDRHGWSDRVDARTVGLCSTIIEAIEEIRRMRKVVVLAARREQQTREALRDISWGLEP